MLHLTAEYYVERAQVQCVGIVIHKVAAIEDDHLKTNVASRVMVWMNLIIMKYLKGPYLG
jgi:hypothetical protein